MLEYIGVCARYRSNVSIARQQLYSSHSHSLSVSLSLFLWLSLLCSILIRPSRSLNGTRSVCCPVPRLFIHASAIYIYILREEMKEKEHHFVRIEQQERHARMTLSMTRAEHLNRDRVTRSEMCAFTLLSLSFAFRLSSSPCLYHCFHRSVYSVVMKQIIIKCGGKAQRRGDI